MTRDIKHMIFTLEDGVIAGDTIDYPDDLTGALAAHQRACEDPLTYQSTVIEVVGSDATNLADFKAQPKE